MEPGGRNVDERRRGGTRMARMRRRCCAVFRAKTLVHSSHLGSNPSLCQTSSVVSRCQYCSSLTSSIRPNRHFAGACRPVAQFFLLLKHVFSLVFVALFF